jgi:hypothetical protein
MSRNYRKEYLSRTKTEEDRMRIREYMREYMKDYRAYVKEHHRWPESRAANVGRVVAFRARKVRQAVAVEKFLEAFDRFEHMRRCAEFRTELRERRSLS